MRFTSLLVFLILISPAFYVMAGTGTVDSPNLTQPGLINGDWIISAGEAIALDGQSVEVKGNVIIENGGSLTLRGGSRLVINSSYDGEYGIYVRGGGTLNVIDSEVSGVEKDYRGKIDYSLKEGMNYISIPFERNNNSIEHVLSPFNNTYYKAFVYDPDDSDHWKFYAPASSTEHIDELPSYSWVFGTGWDTPLKPYITFPFSEASNVSTSQNIYLIFNRTMDSGTIPSISVKEGEDPGGWDFVGWSSVFHENDTAVWAHNPFNTSSRYTLEITGYSDFSGKEGSFNLSFMTSDSSLNVAVRSTPQFMDSNVSFDSNLSVVFRYSMNVSSPPQLMQIYPDTDLGWSLSHWEKSRRENDTAVWTHSRDFPSDSPVIIRLTNYTTDSGINGTEYYLVFRTSDTLSPYIVNTYPLDSDEFVPVDSRIRVVFGESMNSSHVPDIICSQNDVPMDLSFVGWESTYEKNDTAVWSHDIWEPFSNISISVDNYTDLHGNAGNIYEWEFRTGDPRTPGILETTPGLFGMFVSPSGEMRVVFNSSMNVKSVPEIVSSSGSWRFIGWNSTFVPHDTAIWEYSNLSTGKSVHIKIQGYTDLSEIGPRDAIYLYSISDSNIEIQGTVNAYASAHLYAGWNPVAYPFLDPVDVSSIFSSIKGDYDMVRTYSENGSYVYLNSTDKMEPGKSYWIHITEECLWTVSAYSLAGLENLFPRFSWVYEGGSSGNIKDSLIAGCGYESEDRSGLAINSDLVKISGTEFRNGFNGIYIWDSSPIISGSSVHDSHYGIITVGASPILSHNDIFSNKEGGIKTVEGFPIIAYNSIYANDGSGILLYNSTAVLDSNTIASNRDSGIRAENSSALIQSQVIKNNHEGVNSIRSKMTITDSSFHTNFMGIYASFSELNITSSDFSQETYDIVVSNRTYGNITGNTMSASEHAHIFCSSGSNPLIYGNILISGDTGIYVFDAAPTIEGNIIGHNVGSGIHMQDSTGSNISENTISGNGWAGVYMENSEALILDNDLYSNDFGIASFGSRPEIRGNRIQRNRWYGASLIYSDVMISDTLFIDNQWYGILSSYSREDVWNTTIENSTYELYLTHDSRTNMINSSVDEDRVHMDSTSILYMKYLLRIDVRDSLGNRINGAPYTVHDRNGILIDSGHSIFGHLEIPLTAYIRTYSGSFNMSNPYSFNISWNSVSYESTISMNRSLDLNFTFPPMNYSVLEDSGNSSIADMDEWFPSVENSTFSVRSPPGLNARIDNGTLFISPEENWNGVAFVRVDQMLDNSSIWNCTFRITVIGIDDPPYMLGESSVYQDGKFTVFEIIYADVENEPPEYVRVVVDEKTYDMLPADESDSNYTDGKRYVCRVELEKGEHTYYFEMSDGTSAIRTEKTRIDVTYTQDLFMYAIYGLLLMGFLLVLFVAYRIRHLKKVAREDDDSSSVSEVPFALKGPALDRRRPVPRIDPGVSIPSEEEKPIRSTIDRAADGTDVHPASKDSEVKEVPGPPTTVQTSEHDQSAMAALLPEVIGDGTPKEPKYGKKKYLELARKHRKMRVLVEDRDKYRLSSESIDVDTVDDTAEEDVDDILRSIKGD